MSLTAIVWALQQRCGSPLSKIVLIKLADNANDDCEAFPSIAYIADHCEMSPRAVRLHIRDLETAGLLTTLHRRVGGLNLSSVYRLNVPDTFTIKRSGGTAPDAVLRHEVPEGTAGDAGGVRHDVPPNLSIEPVIEPEDTERAVRQVKRMVPEGWRPTEKGMLAAKAILEGGDVEAELQRFRDGSAAKGYKYIDFEAAFRNWCRNAVKFAQRDASKPRHAAGGRRYEPMPF